MLRFLHRVPWIPSPPRRRTGAAVLLICALSPAVLAGQVTPPAQPPAEHSFVRSVDRMDVTDQELATEIRTNLPGMSLANVQSVGVLIQSCNSGGFIDELLALGGRVNVATSARFNELSANNFVVLWTEAMLDASNQFVEARRTFMEGSRRTRLVAGSSGTPEYGSTSLEADLSVLGAGYFTHARGDPNRRLVAARSLKILLWVGQETQAVGSPLSRWNVLKAAKEIIRVGGNVESAAFYDDLGAGLWRYNPGTRRFDQLTEAQFNGLTDLEKKEVVRLTGRGTKANFINTLRRFAAGMAPDGQLFIVLASHGGHNSPVVFGERCPEPERLFTVNSTADETDGFAGDGLCDIGGAGMPLTGICTLRAALREADATPELDEIRFDITVPDGEVPTIRPRGDLGSLGALFPVIVDGTTQPIVMAGAQPREGLVELDGSAAGLDPHGRELSGLEFVGEGSTVRGMVINRFGAAGVRIRPTGAEEQGRHLVEGNRIGTDAAGGMALPNLGSGVEIFEMPGSIVAHNLIAGNRGRGVLIDGMDAIGNHILHNQFGTSADGTSLLPNEQGDIVVVNEARENLFGGNRLVTGAGRPGIDLGDDGVTGNDPGDGDAGANDLQNHPDLVSAGSDGVASTSISGSLSSVPGARFVIEFFLNRACDPAGSGPAETSIGHATVATEATGTANFAASIPIGVPAGTFVTATATDEAGNTSELSRCVPVAATVTPASLDALIADVGTLAGLNQGQINSLLSKLRAARRAISDGRRLAARGQLGAFVNEVRALERSRRLDAGTAAALAARANEILAGL